MKTKKDVHKVSISANSGKLKRPIADNIVLNFNNIKSCLNSIKNECEWIERRIDDIAERKCFNKQYTGSLEIIEHELNILSKCIEQEKQNHE